MLQDLIMLLIDVNYNKWEENSEESTFKVLREKDKKVWGGGPHHQSSVFKGYDSSLRLRKVSNPRLQSRECPSGVGCSVRGQLVWLSCSDGLRGYLLRHKASTVAELTCPIEAELHSALFSIQVPLIFWRFRGCHILWKDSWISVRSRCCVTV